MHRWLRWRTRPFITFWQRGRRGWADEDVWELHTHLATIIADMAKWLRENGAGWCCVHDTDQPYDHEGCGPEDWEQMLHRVEYGFRYYNFVDCHWWGWDETLEETEERAKIQQEVVGVAFDLLKKHWGALWD